MPYVFVSRGGLVESVHAVAAAAADPLGNVALARGDVDTPVFLRSSAKPFIAAALVRDGTAARFGFDAQELAVIAASHAGEPFHVAAVAGILAKIGLAERDLRCGVHPPFSEAAAAALALRGERPSALHNNCSGKHAGILASCVSRGEDVVAYREASHPVQRRILALCARLVGAAEGTLPLALDGCGIPVFAAPLRGAARAFAAFARPERAALDDGDAAALAAVRDAVAAEPEYVSGTGRFDSVLCRATAGRIVGKGGAEGVHGSALRREGLGLVLKVIDGAARAVPPAALGLLHEVDAFQEGERSELETFARPALRNVAGDVVGNLATAADTIR